jgi:hypothetical protein
MERLVVALTALPLAADLLDRFLAWAARRYRVEIDEGDEYPSFRFVLWVRVTHRASDYDHDLWIVKLPSWRWDCIAWDGTQGWTQWALFNRRPFQRMELSAGSGWQVRQIVAR